MKKGVKVLIIILIVLAVLVLAGFIWLGRAVGMGPFKFMFIGYEGEVEAIEQKYDPAVRSHEIVFYGASNFRMWTDMEEDLAGYKVQNHGFGGSTDKMLVEYAPRLLYPYEPEIVFFQTGSNDYVDLKGSDEEKIAICMAYKREMFETFHERLPDAKFVVMSGLLLPGRAQYTPMTMKINEELRALCEETDYMYFVDASAMTFDGSNYKSELFRWDKIHLNHDGQLIWCNEYIKPLLEEIYS